MSNNWQKTTIGESCKFYNGKAHEQQIDDNGDYIVVNSKFISSDGKKFKRTSHILFPLCQDDIVMVMSDVPNGKAIAKCYLIEQDNKYSLNQRICVIRSDKFYTKFLYYHLNRNPYLLSFDNGENQTNLRKDDILKCPLFFPPLSEQKRIVSIVDKAFEGIDRAIVNTEKNLANARELFESYLNAVFTQKGEGWTEKKLGNICSIKHGFAFKGEFFTNEKSDYILLTPGSFHESGGYREQGEKTKYYVGEMPDGYILNSGDFLFAMTEQAVGLLGSSLIVPESDRFLHNQRLGLVQIVAGVAWHNEFFFHQFNTKNFRSAVQSSASGVKVRHTSPSKLGAISVFFPPTIAEQKVVADTLNELLAETQRLEAIYKQKLTALKELKQSILQKAFTGELTADTANQSIQTTEEATV